MSDWHTCHSDATTCLLLCRGERMQAIGLDSAACLAMLLVQRSGTGGFVRILVTGGAGFIGSNLAKRLCADGHKVVAADSFLSAGWSNLIDFPGDVLTLVDHDDVQSMKNLGRFDAIFHQASITGVIAPDGSATSDPHRMMRN